MTVMPTLREVFPEFVVELAALVVASSSPELAEQIPALELG